MRKKIFFILLIAGLNLVFASVVLAEDSGACKCGNKCYKYGEEIPGETFTLGDKEVPLIATEGTCGTCQKVPDYNNCLAGVVETKTSADTVSIPSASELNKLGASDMATAIGKAIKMGTGILGSIALIMVLYGGILWMTSSGNAEKIRQATDILVWSSLGIVVILASYGLVDYVFEAFR